MITIMLREEMIGLQSEQEHFHGNNNTMCRSQSINN